MRFYCPEKVDELWQVLIQVKSLPRSSTSVAKAKSLALSINKDREFSTLFGAPAARENRCNNYKLRGAHS
jgi:hypothetical protein